MKKSFLKNISLMFTLCLIIISANILMGNIEVHNSTIYDEKGDNLIRLHVLANSDSPKDQKVKLIVRDAIIQYLSPKLKDVKSSIIARQIVMDNKLQLIEISKSVLLTNGFSYPVNIEIGIFDFPMKSYGDLTLPEGKYEAVRVLLGEAKGANWWCVLFPPLCFIDDNKMSGTVPKVFQEEDEDSKVQSTSKIKFKLLELFQ